MQKTILFILISLLVFESNAQQERVLGNWQLHFPYKDVVGVEDAGSHVYVAGLLSLFMYEKANGNITIYDKVNPLSDVGVKAIDYERSSKMLAIAYENSNLDILLDGSTLVNVPDLKNKIVAGTKNINAVYCFGSKVYLSTDIGLVVVNATKREVQSTYVIGKTGNNVKVTDAVVNNSVLLAGTVEGVKVAAANAANLQNFTAWTHFDYSSGIPAKSVDFVEIVNGKYYAAISDTLFEYTAGSWNKLAFDSGWSIQNLETIDGKLYISEWRGEYQSRVGILDNGNIKYVTPGDGVRTLQYQPDNSGNIWIADKYSGMIKTSEKILPNGPFSTSCFTLQARGDNMFVAAGGTNSAFSYTFNISMIYVFDDVTRTWKNYNMYNTPALNGFMDVIGVAVNQSGTKAYFCSNLDGMSVLDVNSGDIQHYNYTNSPLQAALGSPGATRVTNIAVDKNDNVWMTNFNTYSPLVLLKPDGTWKRFPLFSVLDQLGKKLIIDRNGYKWIPTRQPDGIMVYYEGDDIDNSNDDVYRFLGSGTGNGNLNNVVVNAIAEDKDGDIWVGTDEGIEIFYCAGSVLSQNGCDAQRIVVERDGFNGYLFGTEVIRSITVDPANRKWIGTNSGAWLISANGKEELLHFTTQNSPLPSDFISDITVNDKTGEVFFATEKGIASYRGDAVAGGETCTGAFVYPNPVKPEYSGPIAIKGLVDDAYVKITDVSGLLVYQGKANGGQMIWNGNDYQGRRAASGIYTVFSSTTEGKGGKCVGKIAFIN